MTKSRSYFSNSPEWTAETPEADRGKNKRTYYEIRIIMLIQWLVIEREHIGKGKLVLGIKKCLSKNFAGVP